MKVKDIMTKDIASLNADDSIERAKQLMKQYDVGSIPVCNQEKVVGMVTDRDIVLREKAEGQTSKPQKIKDIMSSDPVVGTPEMDVHDAAKMMSEKQIRRLPIVENSNLVGIVSLGDISVEPNHQDEAEKALNAISQPSSNNM